MRWTIVAALLLVAGCGKRADTGNPSAITTSTTTAAVPAVPVVPKPASVSAPDGADTPDAPAPKVAAPVAQAVVPRIAYSYTFRFEVPASKLADVERAHRTLCDRLGPTRCQMVGAMLEGRAGAYSRGTLELRVAPDLARGFGADLGTAVKDADGSLLQSGVVGEDLTRQVIDAEAALKAKRTLRDRLQNLLETRQGKLDDLLEVEKTLSETQQELDTATSELAELRTRLDMSKVEIAYESTLPPSGEERRPIANALGSVRDTLGTSVGLLITVVAALLPFAVVIGIGVAIWRAVRRARRARG